MREIFFLLAAFSLFSCSDETINNPADAPYIPQIDNQWIDEGDSTHTFDLNSRDDSLSFGLINGNENFNETFDTFELVGAFHNRDIFLTVNYNFDSTVRYNGTFIEDNRIRLNSKWKTIIISHGQ